MRKPVNSVLVVWGFAVLAGISVLLLSSGAVTPVPSVLRIASGPSEGAYRKAAQVYADRLRAQGLEVVVVRTRGTIENLELLRRRSVDLALVQSGLSGKSMPQDARSQDLGLVSLGSVFFEPVWIFVRADMPTFDKRHLPGRRIAIGPEGSGTRALSLALLAANDLPASEVTLLPLEAMPAANALLADEIDVAVIVAGEAGPAIDRLMRAPDKVRLVDFAARADAYATQLPYLTPVRLPRGSYSLADDLPATGVTLLAPAAFVAASQDINPQIAALMASVMREAHADRQHFAAAGQFPSFLNQDLPMQPDARRFLERGPPLLQSWLSFRSALLLDRLSVIALPLLTVLLPLLRYARPAYRWQMERRIWRRYGELLWIESKIHGHGRPLSDREREILPVRLAELQRRVTTMKVPLAFSHHLLALRRDIAVLRRQLEGNGPPETAEPPGQQQPAEAVRPVPDLAGRVS